MASSSLGKASSEQDREPLIVVLTCLRAQTSYLPSTALAIDEQGGAGLLRLVTVDGDAAAVTESKRLLTAAGRHDWQVMGLDGPLGSTAAMRATLALAAKHQRDVLFFEDDVVLCRNAIRRMRAVQVPADCACVSFFDMKEVGGAAAPGLYARGMNRSTSWEFWGCQSLRFPAAVVAWLAEQDWWHTWVGKAQMASDTIVGALLRRYPAHIPMAVHIPCLVEHVGRTSACAPGMSLTRSRLATNFLDGDFDALSLPRFETLTD
jgi:hypothetical protein